ncbi:MAG: bifunctional YncE family protein/alkaline phosphatase family protein [Fimbriimonas sp.]
MLAVLIASILSGSGAAARPYLHMPSVDSYAKHDPAGTTILPEGRLLTPLGVATPVGRNPHGLAISPDGTQIFVASEGVGQWLANWQDKATVTAQPNQKESTGAAKFSPDGTRFYWSHGEKGTVGIYDAVTHAPLGEVSLNVTLGKQEFEDSYVNGIAVSADGKYLYCADVTNFRLGVIDLAAQKLVASVATGRYPYALAIVGTRLFVANIGQFEYAPVGPSRDPKFDNKGLTFPPFAYPSKEAVNGVEFEGRTIKGLGDPLASEAFSVYGFDIANPDKPKIATVTKTGSAVGSVSIWGRVVGGSGPSFVLGAGKSVFVANSNQDTVEEIQASTGKVISKISLEPSPLVRGYRGVSPSGMVVSKDQSRLYVAESGLNSIAVIDLKTKKVRGLIPTAWYPYRLALSPDGKSLACISFKGYGNGPNAGVNQAKDAFAGMQGAFHSIPVPTDAQLPGLTQKVLANNGIVDASKDYAALKSPVWSNVLGKKSDQIKYVVFITKENHTFDAIFDRIPGSNNDPKLLLWGNDQVIKESDQPTLEHVSVMRNHNKLAREYTVSDNFYMEPEASGVGHRWLIGIQPNNFCQMLYTLGWNFKLNSKATGRLASFGSNGSMAPEDYPEAGAMWDNLSRHGISFRNYGEGFEFAGVDEGEFEGKTGARETINMPMPASLYNNTSRDFPIFNMNIPDVYRYEYYRDEVKSLYLSGKKPFPSFTNICICNDHGTDANAKKGYPYRASWMADNDLALGKIVEFLSHTPQWKNMLILVTQDDSGGEPDHVDAQRSVLLAISPYIKRKYVSHRHTTITSMHRTLYSIFGLPPLNLFDALSNDFSDCFNAKPDFTPYTAVDVDKRLFDWPKARDKKDPNYVLARRLPTIERDTYDRESERR